MKFLQVVLKYHKIFLEARGKNYLNQFSRRKKKLKNGHFWPPLHKSKLIFHAYEVDIQFFMNSQI